MLLLSIFLIIFQYSISQEIENNIKRNLIEGSIASSGIINGMISIGYERNLINSEKVKINIKGTYGKYYQIHTGDASQSYPVFPSITSGINSLFGKSLTFLKLIWVPDIQLSKLNIIMI